LVKSFGEEKLIFGSLLVVAVSLVLIPYAGGLGTLLFALALFAGGSGINRAPTMGLISLNAPASEQGATMGVAQSAGTLARSIGPVLATFLYSIRAPLPYLVSAGVAAGAGLLAWQALCKPASSKP
jgi:predicted MFS family arabinose efflux permease